MRPSFGIFAFLSVLAFNPWAHAESYTLPGESSRPAAEELIGSPGLVGIYYGQLPKDGHPRPEHRPAAVSRRSLQACIASLPLQSSLMSKTYLKSDHFNGGGS